ncbi:bifunctional nuclease family protein [Neolewinella antarctica]|uniref:BFN domain-containing protein n=1 Tax=Neolewinella antarctica TaxID=442734 RepID=A0ABX0X885_9BACT|nr:bifunctional nuclease family protein [Neolewinella antarctica]NJC25189.1 hypothetical protein [Neolewinella antarctica]
MNKIELRVMAISRSVTQSTNYAVVLGEREGARRLPVIIGSQEAQAIAIAIEGLEGSRPMTHDLFKNTLDILRTEMREIIINDLREGVFFARLVLNRNSEIIEVDSRTSDALALAVRFDCPIYTYAHILEEAGITLEDEEEDSAPDETESASNMTNEDNLARYNAGELSKMLEEVLGNENYERAALIRDELNRRGEN